MDMPEYDGGGVLRSVVTCSGMGECEHATQDIYLQSSVILVHWPGIGHHLPGFPFGPLLVRAIAFSRL